MSENLDEIQKMLQGISAMEKEPETTAPKSSTAAGKQQFQKNGEETPNIYSDIKIEPIEPDVSKLKKSYAYAIVAVDENPVQETIDMTMKVVDILKAKRYIYRYNGDTLPSLANMALKRQDLTMPDSYQVFLFMPPKDEKDYDGITITSKRPAILAGRIAKHFTKYVKKDETNPEIKHTMYGFANMSGAVRNILANNIHMYLGKDCYTKLNFLLMYSVDGAEKSSDIVKDTTPRRAADVIKIAEALNIPIFNMGKSDGLKRLLEYINKDTISEMPF